MRLQLAYMLKLAETRTDMDYRKMDIMLSIDAKTEKSQHKINLLDIYIEFLTNKLNQLKKEL